MEIQTSISKADYTKYLKELTLHYKLSYKILWSAFAALLIASDVNSYGNTWLIIVTDGLSTGILLFLALVTIPYTFWVMKFENSFEQNTSDLTIILNDDGINMDDGDITAFYSNDTITAVNITKNYIGISTANKQLPNPYVLIIIPLNGFASFKDATLFYRKMLNIKYKNAMQGGYVKPPYALALLGIIPFVGAVNGIIMIIQGVVKYKNILYSVLGLAGIMFTIYIFSFFWMKPNLNDAAFSKGFAHTSQTQLNEVVKDIEFYKLQNNHYPDSLQQLTTANNTVDIYDPIYSFRARKSIPFNYKKIGKRYTIYSSGLDMVPNTKDDIYPSINVSDTTKFGFIRVN